MLQINIPFAEALEQMSSYAKFIKVYFEKGLRMQTTNKNYLRYKLESNPYKNRLP